MKSYLKLIAAVCAAFLMTAAAIAADATPAGTWKWTLPARGDRPAFEQTLMLAFKDGALTGTLVGAQGPNGQIPDVAIGEASFKDGAIAFTVTREFNGNKRTSKYEGKLEGDTIKGSVERPNRDGAVRKNDWTATRAK